MEKRLDTYKDLCTQYYDLDNPVIPADEWEFYHVYAKKAQGAILEPMCGTGRFLLPLMQEGFTIEGFDASKHMLDLLYHKAAQADLKPTVWQSFIEDMLVDKTYDLIFIPAGSFNLLTDIDVVRKSLAHIYAALAPGSVFVFELITLDFVRAVQTGTISSGSVVRADGKRIASRSIQTPLVDGVSTSTCRYILTDNSEVLSTEIEEYSLRFYTDQEIRQELLGAGFSAVQGIKAFQQGALPDVGDMVVVYECKK